MTYMFASPHPSMCPRCVMSDMRYDMCDVSLNGSSSPADRAAFRGRTLLQALYSSSEWDSASEAGSTASGKGGKAPQRPQFAGVNRELENTLYFM